MTQSKDSLLSQIEENKREMESLYALSTILSSDKDFVGQAIIFLKQLSEELALDQSAIIEIKTSDKAEKKANSKDNAFEVVAANNLCQQEIQEIFSAISAAFKKQLLAKTKEKEKEAEAPLSIKYKKNQSYQEMYCLPLFVDGLMSHMLIVSRKYIKDYEHEAKKHYRFLYLISNNLAFAISRGKMLAKIKRDQNALLEAATQNKIFLEISKDLASSLDPYCILQKAFDQFRKIISFTSIAILLYDDLDRNYRLTIHSCKPISKGYHKKLSKEIYDLFIEYPAQPNLTQENFKEFSTSKDSKREKDTIKSFKHRLHLPIIFSDKIKGLIHLARTATEPAFDNKDLDITSQFTGIFLTSIKNAMIHKKTEKLAFTDPLTELFNHRYFQETLNNEFVRAKRYDKPLSLMIIDIDFFKKFNDTYGHLVGDKVLRHVAKIFSHSMREQIDTVARYGGEEFAVILPETTIEGARHFAERIRASVEEARIPHEGQELSITLSIGVSSTKVTNCHKTATLIEAADIALYEAKELGRNKVVTYQKAKV
jgi:diguanylate cyclase (GGDEF)-like protein